MDKRLIDITDGDLHVRMLQQSDLQKMIEWLTDERVLEFFSGRDTQWTEANILEHYFAVPNHETEFLRVIIELDGEPIGYGQIYRLYGELFDEYQWPDTGEVIYAMDQFIGKPELWDIGIGTKYVRMITDYIVKTRDASAILMDPRKENPRAVRCYQKAGYEIVGELPAHELHEGKFDDCYLMVYRSPEKNWDEIAEEHAAAYLAADVALGDLSNYSLREQGTGFSFRHGCYNMALGEMHANRIEPHRTASNVTTPKHAEEGCSHAKDSPQN